MVVRQNIGSYYTVIECMRLLGLASKTSVRYRVLKYRVSTRRYGLQDYIHLAKLRETFEKEGK